MVRGLGLFNQNGDLFFEDRQGTAPLTPSYFHAYETGGGQSFTGSWVEVNLDTESKNTGGYTFSTGGSQVTFDNAGTYQIHYYISIYGDGSGNRSDGMARLQLDTGSGFSEMPGTRANYYIRAASNGQQSGSSVTIIRDMNAGDTIRLQTKRERGSATLNTEADGVGITIRRLR